MKKYIKYFLAGIAYIVFFLFIDDSGVNFKEHMTKIKKWANK